MHHYLQQHWKIFKLIPPAANTDFGCAPVEWIAMNRLINVPVDPIFLSKKPQSRFEVHAICQNPTIPVLLGYVCVMAWARQGAEPGGCRHVTTAWTAYRDIIPKLIALRAGGLTRCQSYDLFCGDEAIPGLGPACFTKLIHFFSPKPECYIMDQWSAKSVNMLTGKWLIKMKGHSISNDNKGGNYQLYCEEIDGIAARLGAKGQEVENMMILFNKWNPGPWQCYLRKHWALHAPSARYRAIDLHAIYPHIPLASF